MKQFFPALVSFPLLFCFPTFSQNPAEDPTETINLFNKTLIAELKISKAKIDYAYKFDLKPIKESEDCSELYFNQNGEIIKIIEVRVYGERTDSTIAEYLRNQDNLITAIVHHDSRFTTVELKSFNNLNLMGRQFYQMPKNFNWNENLNNNNLVWSDSLFWNNDEAVIYNQYKKKYKVQKYKRDELGRITELTYYDHAGKLTNTSNYEYEKNRLISIEEVPNSSDRFRWKKEIEYQAEGISQVKYYKNGKLEYVRKLSYSANGIPDLDLSRNEIIKKMTIAKISYSR